MASSAELLTLEFGSRSGSWLAFCYFAAVFGLLGWALTREIRRRSSETRPRLARAIGLLFFIGPLSLICASSLGGFYEADVDRNMVRLHFLVPGVGAEVPATEIAAVRTTPAYRGQWRLQIETASGSRYESATSHRDVVSESAARLKQALE
jgi:hypothetical protein